MEGRKAKESETHSWRKKEYSAISLYLGNLNIKFDYKPSLGFDDRNMKGSSSSPRP